MNANLPGIVLLATDGSEDASAATRAAVDLSKAGGSELHVVHAFEFIPPREYMSVALRLRSPSGFRRQGQEALDEQAGLIEEAGGTWRRPTSEKARRSTRSSTPPTR